MKRELGLVAVSASVLVALALWPQLDLATSALFFDGTGFPLERDPWNTALRWVLRVAPFVPVLVAAGVLVATRWLPPTVFGLARRGWAVILLTFVLGPGLLVNRLLKAYGGRARPRNVTEFGGDKLFTPPHVWADQCAANCSFVSGEVSAVTALALALLLLLSANRPTLRPGIYQAGVAVACILPVLSAFQRISAGAHFLSDAIFAVLFTLLVALVVQRMVGPKPR